MADVSGALFGILMAAAFAVERLDQLSPSKRLALSLSLFAAAMATMVWRIHLPIDERSADALNVLAWGLLLIVFVFSIPRLIRDIKEGARE